MIYDISLEIAYDYPDAVKDARHILRVRPRAERGQKVFASSLVIDPKPDETFAERDFFGNAVDHVLVLPSHAALSVTMKARVSVAHGPLRLSDSPSVADVAALAEASREAGPVAPMHFLANSRIVRHGEPITDYVAAAMDPSAPIGEAALALARLIREDFEYSPGATEVDTPLSEAFEGRKGVCQDFAHIMIAGLRGIGLPAAYVSGFIRTDPPPGRPRLSGADAMHAWVGVWLGPRIGWRGFDPTNGCVALDDHVVVATGRDYADCSPIAGVLITAGPHTTKHTVDVTPVG